MLKKPVLQKFDKELFKNSVIYNVKTLYRKTLEEATQQQIFQAVAYAIKDVIVDNWMNTQKEYAKQDPKTVYYLSMEFLMGRALGNNLINLQAYNDVAEPWRIWVSISIWWRIRSLIPALGNGGLGRLAALLPGFPGNHGDIPLMAAASVTVMACSSRRSVTDTR